MLAATFYGVRGSTPCSCAATAEIGGNTSAVLVQVSDTEPILLDVGTGARYAGRDLTNAGLDKAVTLLVSHLHWDHLQGLPFFSPVLTAGSQINLVGPKQDCDQSLAQVLDAMFSPPVFPVERRQLPCEISVTETSFATFEVGRALITVRPVPHCGATNGYRIDGPAGGSIAYLPDHQQPLDGSNLPTDDVIDLCAGVDLLVHDCQYSDEMFSSRSDWGHSTPAFAAAVARSSGARRLVLTHHDPSSTTETVERLGNEAAEHAGSGIEVIVATEGAVLKSGLAVTVQG